MSRKIIIDKYQGNTHYSVHVIDSFGQEHHLGYLGMNLTMEDIDKLSAKDIVLYGDVNREKFEEYKSNYNIEKMDLLNWYTKKLYKETKTNNPNFIKALEDYLHNS